MHEENQVLVAFAMALAMVAFDKNVVFVPNIFQFVFVCFQFVSVFVSFLVLNRFRFHFVFFNRFCWQFLG